MSDIRLVNVVPIVNGWNDAAKKNLEEAKTLMASGNHLDYNKGVVKESVANLVSGFADDLMSAPFIDPETLRPMAHWDGQYDGYYDGEPVVRCKDCEHFKNYGRHLCSPMERTSRRGGATDGFGMMRSTGCRRTVSAHTGKEGMEVMAMRKIEDTEEQNEH